MKFFQGSLGRGTDKQLAGAPERPTSSDENNGWAVSQRINHLERVGDDGEGQSNAGSRDRSAWGRKGQRGGEARQRCGRDADDPVEDPVRVLQAAQEVPADREVYEQHFREFRKLHGTLKGFYRRMNG